jgi:hypothetical protein
MTLPIRIQLGTPVVQPPLSANLYRVLTDYELGRTNRPRLPMVFHFRETVLPISREWQWYLIAINPGMALNAVAHLLMDGVAFCNNTGLNMPGDPRQNWITNEDLTSSRLPAWSKCFTCGDNLVQIIDGIITAFDGSKPPPLKPGYTWPMSREQALNPEIYRYMPQSYPHMFFAAHTTGTDFHAHPFPNGALYPWYMDGKTPVSFLPHVAAGVLYWPPDKVVDNTARLVKLG